MQKRALSLVLCVVMAFAMSTQALAAESAVELVNDVAAQETNVVTEIELNSADESVQNELKIVIDGVILDPIPTTIVESGVTYVSYWYIVKAIYPDATATWVSNHAYIEATDLELSIYPYSTYIEVDGRYLWLDSGVKIVDSVILVPIRSLCEALGASLDWDNVTKTISITSGGAPLVSGDEYYDETSVYWLSRIINAESSNQSLSGKIAVGNVVLNRVASTVFPNTIYDVIFQTNQFSPASNGSIYNTPSDESIMAAKLCLEGASTAEDCLFFVNPSIVPNSWASRNRIYVQTIGSHAFYG